MFERDGFICSPHLPWWLDVTRAGLSNDQLAQIPWERVWTDQAAQESGAAVNLDENRAVGHTWLRAPDLAPTVGMAEQIESALDKALELARQLRDGHRTTPAGEPFTDVLHIGIGGSQLGPSLLIDALAQDDGLAVHFLDNTDPDGIDRTLRRLGERLCTTLCIIISKSGGTAETMNAAELAHRALRQRGLSPADHSIAITVAGSKLSRRAQDASWLAELPLWEWVGGRFSVTSVVGVFTAALAGIDVHQLLAGARDMDAWTRTTDWSANPAAMLAGAWFALNHGACDRSLVVLPYSDRLLLLSRYLQQLVMESIGKRTDRQGAEVFQGLTVYGNKGSTDQHAFVQQLRDGRDDTMTFFVQVLHTEAQDPPLSHEHRAGDYLQGFLLGTRRALAASGRPTMTLTIPDVSPRTLGGIIALFERAVAMYASMIDINAFHQPGVEAGKLAASALLSTRMRAIALLRAGPSTLETLADTLESEADEVFYLLQRMVHMGEVTYDPVASTYAWVG